MKTQPKKILYIVASTGIGGVETFVRHTAQFHDREKFKPSFIFLRSGPLWDQFKKESFPDLFLYPHPFRLSRPWTLIPLIKWLRKIIREENIDLVHSTMAYAALFGALPAWLERKPHVWFQHGPVSGWMDALAQWLPCKLIYGNSRFTIQRQNEIRRFFIPARKIELVYPGVNLEESKVLLPKINELNFEYRKKWGVSENDFLVGILCRLQEWKGVHLFIEAFAKLKTLHTGDNQQIKGLIFSEIQSEKNASSYQTHLKNLILKTNPNVRFVGHTPDPLKAICALDIVVNASITPEPLGLTLIEAMALSKVPIAPQEGGPLDIIENGKTGCFFSPRNPEDLSQKILSLTKDKNLYHTMGKNAELAVRNKFDVKNSILKLEQSYDVILGLAHK